MHHTGAMQTQRGEQLLMGFGQPEEFRRQLHRSPPRLVKT